MSADDAFKTLSTKFVDRRHAAKFIREREYPGRRQSGKPLGPVQSVTGVNLLPAGVDVDLDAVAVEFNFVEPLVSLGHLRLQGGKLRPDESRHRGFGTLGLLPIYDPTHTPVKLTDV
jgi:hypothetical protein